ncbi:histidine phosphatase family protein [Rhodoferax antarcticus]|uniref:Phosphoglycerate mutase family protein n=1 Tax=Rhodoferax antarcticus ANT.BR TaxID=1111071 RepID=A0A1Q8YE58_9BURK|nr:histidine phosphatase family protein [Rhodoferax antarcticus]APW46117.1 phosphoglycerate kinase [Rhodoferax antarcticus]MCW2310312.1 alpha-ribazole phosphatase [Rhodoferax antarcticus]OLP06287.1 phosphoglycerate mutase family protein [Rhodoferax antarcticus ANT.BR]
MRLTLARHAQPLVAAGVCYGALDMPADLQATQQAAEALAQTLSTGVRMLCSPLQRCELLAQTLQGLRPDLTYKTDLRLREMNFGRFEGQRWDSIAPGLLDEWTANFWQHRFGGVESVAELMARVASVWGEALSSAQPQVWITHAGVIRAATLLDQGVRRIDRAQDWPQAAPAFGQWLVLPPHPRTNAGG